MRKNCYVWDTKLIWTERRYIFSATNYYVGHKFGPRYIFSVPGGTDVSSNGTDGLPGPTKIPLIYGRHNPEKKFFEFCINCLRGWWMMIWWSTSKKGRRRQIQPDGSRADCYFGVPSFYSTQASGLCAVCGPFVILLLPYTAPNGLLLWQTYFVLTQAAVQHQEHLNCTHDQGSPITNLKR